MVLMLGIIAGGLIAVLGVVVGYELGRSGR
jgi:hypothetical protein